MNFIKADLPGVVIIEPKVFKDSRGYFFESYSKREFDEAIGKVEFLQDNQSRSVRGVVRGFHFQRPPFAQAKLVRCTHGKVLDIAIDIRRGSPTFMKHISVELSEDNHRMLFIPKGFAHGFAVLSDYAVFQYKCDNYYNPESEAGISILDDSFGIDWPFDLGEAILSEKDTRQPFFKSINSPFTYEN